MGKYDRVLPGLPRLPADQEDQNRDFRINEMVQKLKENLEWERSEKSDPAPPHSIKIPAVPELRVRLFGDGASQLADLYTQLRDFKEQIKAAEDAWSLLLDSVSLMVEQAYEAAGITSLKLDSGKSVSSQPEPHASVKDNIAFRRWAIAEGFEETFTMPWQTMNKIVKERLLEAKEIPAGVEVYYRPKLVLR